MSFLHFAEYKNNIDEDNQTVEKSNNEKREDISQKIMNFLENNPNYLKNEGQVRK